MDNKNSSDELKSKGLKRTSERILILEIIRRGHLDANEIFRIAQASEPRISLSTVYRTLKRLKELGLIDELNFNEEHHHYEIKKSPEACHLVCLKCGKVIEFDYRLSAQMKRKIRQEKQFSVTGSEIQVFGYCAKCRGKQRI